MVMQNCLLFVSREQQEVRRSLTRPIGVLERSWFKPMQKIYANLDITLADHAAKYFQQTVVLASMCNWIESTINKVTYEARLKSSFYEFFRPTLVSTQWKCKVCNNNARKGYKNCGCVLHDHCFEECHGINSDITRISFS